MYFISACVCVLVQCRLFLFVPPVSGVFRKFCCKFCHVVATFFVLCVFLKLHANFSDLRIVCKNVEGRFLLLEAGTAFIVGTAPVCTFLSCHLPTQALFCKAVALLSIVQTS